MKSAAVFPPSLWNVGMQISAAAHNGTSVQVQQEQTLFLLNKI